MNLTNGVTRGIAHRKGTPQLTLNPPDGWSARMWGTLGWGAIGRGMHGRRCCGQFVYWYAGWRRRLDDSSLSLHYMFSWGGMTSCGAPLEASIWGTLRLGCTMWGTPEMDEALVCGQSGMGETRWVDWETLRLQLLCRCEFIPTVWPPSPPRPLDRTSSGKHLLASNAFSSTSSLWM